MSLVRINRQPSARDLRVFAVLSFLMAAGLGFVAARNGAPAVALAVAVIGLAIGATGVFRPTALRSVYVGACYAVWPIGFAVSHLLLAAIYFLVVTPVGLLLRLAGKDPLQRRFEPGRVSYWTPREPSRPPESYFRQH